ncbi:MAG TPA: DUF2267 domain-containing protein [Candidatus Baltobacteraceae bacterium]|jgi:uncharacterized protein (DUF2267 family)|nr:DUF2267 domain-containing protein [Candidatus Baltobacteraceae bacterium]
MTTMTTELFEPAITDANAWLDDICLELGWADRFLALRALRSSLQALRDRLSPEQNAQLAAQLPTMIRGIYYEAWQPKHADFPVRNLDTYLDSIAWNFRSDEDDFEIRDVVCAVYRVLARRITPGERQKLLANLPSPLLSLWEQALFRFETLNPTDGGFQRV